MDLDRELRQRPDAFMQLLLTLCARSTFSRILQCPTYPVRVSTSDLSDRVQRFRDSLTNKYAAAGTLAHLFERVTRKNSRKLRGQYFTPQPIAELVAKRLDVRPNETIVDAGCGTGIFAAEIMRNMTKTATTVRYLGVECNPILALCSALTLDYLNAPGEWRVLYANFLLLDPEYLRTIGYPKVDAVISNPPFVRHHRILGKRNLIVRIRQRTGISVSSFSGLHSFFLAQSTALLRSNGRMVFVFPLEMNEVNHGAGLLTILKPRFNYSREQVSEGLAIFTFSPREAGTATPSTESEVDPRSTQVPLRSVAKVRRGISTGCNWFFTLNDQTAEKWSISRRFLKPVVPTKILFSRYVFDKNECNRFRELGRQCWLLVVPAEYDLETLPQALRAYLGHGLREQVNMVSTCKMREPWYTVPLSPSPDMLFTYMSRGEPKFVHNESEAYILTNLLGIRLEDTVDRRGLDMRLLAELFTKNLSDWMQRSKKQSRLVGRQYSGGLVKIEPGDLKEMPVSSEIMKLLGIPSLRRYA